MAHPAGESEFKPVQISKADHANIVISNPLVQKSRQVTMTSLTQRGANTPSAFSSISSPGQAIAR
jgi:hypothetical protein